MTTLKNIQIIEASKLQKVTYEDSEFINIGLSQIHTFHYELQTNTAFKFQLVFELVYSPNQKFIKFKIYGLEPTGSWPHIYFNNSSIANDQICTWVIDDFEAITTHILKEIHTNFPYCELRFENDCDSMVKNKIAELQNQLSNKQLV